MKGGCRVLHAGSVEGRETPRLLISS